jgi:hypothetical protein
MSKKLFLLLGLVALFSVWPFWPKGSEALQDPARLSDGEKFPTLKGKTLAGQEVTLPPANGKATVLGLAFSTRAEADLKNWVQPFYDTFLAKHEGVFEAGNFEGNVYLVALLSGSAALGGKSLQEKAAKATDAELRPHILISSENPAAIIKALDVKDKDKAYFAVLDAGGNLKALLAGPYNEAKMEELAAKASEVE